MKKACRGNLPALIFLFALLILWQLGAMEVNAAYILPTPIQILQKLWALRAVLFTVHLPATMLVTFVGLAISLVLGLMFEKQLRLALSLTDGSLLPFLQSPYALLFLALALFSVLWSWWKARRMAAPIKVARGGRTD